MNLERITQPTIEISGKSLGWYCYTKTQSRLLGVEFGAVAGIVVSGISKLMGNEPPLIDNLVYSSLAGYSIGLLGDLARPYIKSKIEEYFSPKNEQRRKIRAAISTIGRQSR